jgi:translocation and assembly module TamB
MNWKRIIGWTAAILGILIVLVVVGGYAILRSSAFHRYVLAKIEQTGNEATGGQVQIQKFDFHPSTLTANIYGLIIRGTEGPNQAPLLAVEKITLKLKILSVFQHKVNLHELIIQRPMVHLLVDNKGHSNIPSPNAPKEKSSQTNLFDLAVGHVLLSYGEIYYNNEQTSLDANVYDLKSEIAFNLLTTKYSGWLKYTHGLVKYAELASPLPHQLELQFSATPAKFSIPQLVMTVGSSRFSLQGDMTEYGNPRVHGTYNLLLHTQDFAGMLKTAASAGDVALSGTLHYQNAAGQPMLRNVVLDGQLSSGELKLVSSQAQMAVRDVRGRLQLANGNLVAHDVAASLLNGRLSADLSMQHLESTPASKLRAALNGVSLEALKQALSDRSYKTMPVSGTVNGTVEASWVGSVANLRAATDIKIRGAVHNQKAGSAATVPIDGTIHANYDGRRNLITLRQTALRTPASSVAAQGTLGDRSNLTLQAWTGNLRELAILASALQKPGTQLPGSKPLSISGVAVANATITGTLKSPRINAQLSAQNLQVEGSQWSSLRLAAQASPSEIRVQNGSLIGARQGQVTFSGSVGLRNWSYLPLNPIAANLSVRQMPVAQLQQLAGVNYPVMGNLSADMSLAGTQLSPVGHGSAQLLKGKAYNQPIQNLALRFDAAANSVNSSLDVKLGAGSATAKLVYYPKTRAYQVQFGAPHVVLQELEIVQAKNLPVEGVLSASASGSGTFDDPQLTATIQVPQLQIEQTKVTGIKTQLNVANRRADVALTSDIAQATIRARGTVDLTGDYYTVAALDTTTVPLEPLLAVYVSSLPSELHSRVELHATLKGPLKDKSRMEAHLVIPSLAADYQKMQIANKGPIRVDYANSVVTIQPGELSGTDTSLRFQGRVPWQGPGAMDVTAQGSVNLRLLRILNPDLQTSGVMALDLRGSGSTGHPGIQGQIKLQEVSVITSSAPAGVENLSGVLNLGNGQIQIARLTGQSGGGEITVGGFITYEPQMQFNMAINAKSVRLLYPEGIRSVLDGNMALTGSMQDASLNGRVLIDSLSFTPEFDLASFMSQSSGASLPPSEQSFPNNLKLNISVQSTAALSAVSSEVSVEGQANLKVIGTAADPVIVGRADLNSGEIFFMKNRYQLERGIINFINPNRTEPNVNILITTTIQQYNLSLTLVGPVNKLRTSYTSDPPLPPVDIINLVARGKTTEESAPGNFDANQVLAQGLAGQVSSRLGKLAGISSLTIDPLFGGSNQNPSARVAVQQRVTKNFIFTFSTDVTQPQAEIVQGEYQISKRWSVSATRNQYGGFAFDGRFHTTF